MGTAVACALHLAGSSPGRHMLPGLRSPMLLWVPAEGVGIMRRESGPAGSVALRCTVGALVPSPTAATRWGGGVPRCLVRTGQVAVVVFGTVAGDLATQVGAHIVRYAGCVMASPWFVPGLGVLGGRPWVCVAIPVLPAV
jgi:hypothetical protein